jgi:hypothetical protein
MLSSSAKESEECIESWMAVLFLGLSHPKSVRSFSYQGPSVSKYPLPSTLPAPCRLELAFTVPSRLGERALLYSLK